jgi:cellulose synthase/poly-beta-1,6-N-acetylglucosamine synthase-like glycosyltransferase
MTESAAKAAESTTGNQPARPVRSDEAGRRRLGDFWYRAAEMVPGLLIWTVFILSVALSFIQPLAVIVFIIVFDAFWLFRIVHFCVLVTLTWLSYRRDTRVDWAAKIAAMPEAAALRHVVFLPTYKESAEVIRGTLRAIVDAAYPNRRESFIVVLGGEERAGREAFMARARELEREFGGEFLRFLVTVHPADLPDEIPGKGANQHYMGHRVQALIDELGVPYERVIVSAFDCDTVAHPQYFSCLTYKFLTHPTPTRTSYQPMALYSNNIWEATAPVRLGAFGTVFWLMGELVRPDRLSTFSSHSMSLRALVDVGFWQKDIVTEDSRIFLQCLLHYDGDYSVTPLYMPVSMDAVEGDSLWSSMGNLYRQQRRWAWGIEHFPYLISRFHRNRAFPARLKVFYLWNLVEGMFTWATAPILIFVLGRLPLLVASESVRLSVFFQNAPRALETLMTLAMVGVFFTALMSLTLLPPLPDGSKRRHWLFFLLQWALVPVTFTVFGAFPAIDAQTRLMLGRYLGFNVTAKKRN